VAGDSKEISVKAILKPLYEAEQTHGSIVLGLIKKLRDAREKANESASNIMKVAKAEQWRMWNLKQGLYSLPESLEKAVTSAGSTIKLNTTCNSIKFKPEKGAEIHLDQETLHVDHVFAGVPAHSLGKLLPENEGLAKYLSAIPFVSIALVNLEYKGEQIKQQAFGFLVPSKEKCDVLGVVFDSCNFPTHNGLNSNKTRLSVMMGGRWFEEMFGKPDSANKNRICQIAINAVRKHLGITAKPTRNEVHVLKECIPQYVVGHSKRLSDIRSHIDMHQLPISLIGSSYDGVSVNDCIANAKLAVTQYLSK